jgi:hypothetical protein
MKRAARRARRLHREDAARRRRTGGRVGAGDRRRVRSPGPTIVTSLTIVGSALCVRMNVPDGSWIVCGGFGSAFASVTASRNAHGGIEQSPTLGFAVAESAVVPTTNTFAWAAAATPKTIPPVVMSSTAIRRVGRPERGARRAPRANRAAIAVGKRRGRDSNPRSPCRDSGFQDRCIRPLCHPSGDARLAAPSSISA